MAIDLGKIAMTLEGSYDSSITYNKLDTVTFNGSSYTSSVDNNNAPITDTTSWQLIAKKGQDGNDGIPGPIGEKGDKGEDGIDGINGTNAQSFNYKGEVVNYAGLPATGNIINDAYFNRADNLWYIYNGTSFPSNGQGLPVGVLSLTTTFDKTNTTKAESGKNIYDASEDLVKKALESPGSVYAKYGWDTNYVGIAGTTTMVCNMAYLTGSATIGRVTINAPVSGNFEIYKVNGGVTPTIGNALTKTYITTVALTVGINVIDTSIPGVAGDMIAIKNLSGSIGYTDGGTHQYFDASPATILNINSGYIAYYFETSVQGSVQYPLDNLKKVVTISTTDFDKILEGSDTSSSIHSRITIEGQSNALGVGFASGLTVPPYNTSLFDWTLEFSRVFIWNPKTDKYENIQIGVNNMASWDSYYTIGAPTPQSTFGPEIGVALIWLQTHKSGNLYIDKNVGDGRPISYFQKGTAYYTEKINRKTKADLWLKDRGFSVSEVGFIWVQGEADMSQTDTYYKSQLDMLINDRLTDGFIDSKTKLIITQIPVGSGNYGAGVFNAKSQFVASNKNSILVPYTNNFNGDNIHLNTTGQINLGMLSAIKILPSDNLNYTDLETKIYWNK
jgi:hypothetical protein